MKLIILATFLILLVGVEGLGAQSNFSYKIANGEYMTYEIQSFHQYNETSFTINVSNDQIKLQSGMKFNITFIDVNNTNYFELEINNKNTTDLNQKYLIGIDFAIPTSSNKNDFVGIDNGNYHYYIAGNFWHQDYSYSQIGTNLVYELVSQISWSWKTGWLNSYYYKEYEKTSKGVILDYNFVITQLGYNPKTSPGFIIPSFFLSIVLIMIYSKRRRKYQLF